MEDPNFLIKLETKIKEKYGEEAIKHPFKDWDEEKELDYIEQLKKESVVLKERQVKEDKEEHNGFFISKKLITKKSERTCPVCSVYSFSSKDDLYMNRYSCCFNCYVKYIEGREERWEQGWRPVEEEK